MHVDYFNLDKLKVYIPISRDQEHKKKLSAHLITSSYIHCFAILSISMVKLYIYLYIKQRTGAKNN